MELDGEDVDVPTCAPPNFIPSNEKLTPANAYRVLLVSHSRSPIFMISRLEGAAPFRRRLSCRARFDPPLLVGGGLSGFSR